MSLPEQLSVGCSATVVVIIVGVGGGSVSGTKQTTLVSRVNSTLRCSSGCEKGRGEGGNW